MRPPSPTRSLLVAAGCLAFTLTPTAAVVRVSGSTTVNPVVVEAAALLTDELGVSIRVDTLGGSSGGIAALADGRADVAMSSRPLRSSDQEKYPAARFEPLPIGLDALALVVSRDVWEGGIRALSKDEVRSIYEGELTNWHELGGPDRRIVFFNKEPGRGTWEVFASWLYGDSDSAPLVNLLAVGSNEEARSKVASTRGAISQLSAAWADGQTTFALAIRGDDGLAVVASVENVQSRAYPLSRTLLLITNGRPGGEVRVLLDFLRSRRGQQIVARHGYLPLAAVDPGDDAP
ncbi:MAG: phosphate ABC transporter substrate-binding protein [Thermoanaerobaculia bacterium]